MSQLETIGSALMVSGLIGICVVGIFIHVANTKSHVPARFRLKVKRGETSKWALKGR